MKKNNSSVFCFFSHQRGENRVVAVTRTLNTHIFLLSQSIVSSFFNGNESTHPITLTLNIHIFFSFILGLLFNELCGPFEFCGKFLIRSCELIEMDPQTIHAVPDAKCASFLPNSSCKKAPFFRNCIIQNTLSWFLALVPNATSGRIRSNGLPTWQRGST